MIIPTILIDPSRSPPEIIEEPNRFLIKPHSQVVLQCKIISSQLPTVKWFKKRDIDQQVNYIAEDLPIKFFENFYEPLTLNTNSMGLRAGNNTFHSKLILNDVIRKSVHVCVAINYHGISYREFFIDINDDVESNDYDDEQQYRVLLELPELKYEILFIIPLIILILITAVLSTILYLLIMIRSKITVRMSKCDFVQ